MRFWWSWRWRQRAAVESGGAISGATEPRHPARDWARLPPLSTTVEPWPPLLAPLLRMPSVAGSVPLLDRRNPAVVVPEPRPRGRVIGLARSSAGPAAELVHPLPRTPAPVAAEQRVSRVAPTVRGTAYRPPLTEAVDDYVGEPREPAVPHRTSSFERLLAQFDGAPDALAKAAMLALGGLSSEVTTPPPTGTPPTGTPSTGAPPTVSGPAGGPAARDEAQRVLRRATLAQSRRMGLASRPNAAPTGRPDRLDPFSPPGESDESDLADLPESPREPDPPAATAEPEPVGVVADGPDLPAAAGEPDRVAVADEPAPVDVVAESSGPRPADELEPDGAPEPPAPPAPPAPARPQKLSAASPGPGAARVGIGPPLAASPRLAGHRTPVAGSPVTPAHRPPDRLATQAEVSRQPHSAPAPATRSQSPATPGHPPAMRDESPAPDHEPLATDDESAAMPYRAVRTAPPLPVVEPHDASSARGDRPVRGERVPVDVAATFQARFGIDVASVPVHRGPAVSGMALAASARAFTQQGEVFLPDEAGESHSTGGRALLAHELVHVVQQRVLGSRLPSEQSPEGTRLEAAALATEGWFRGERPAPPALIHHPGLRTGTVSSPAPAPARQRADDMSVPTVPAELGTLVDTMPATTIGPAGESTTDGSVVAAPPVVTRLPPAPPAPSASPAPTGPVTDEDVTRLSDRVDALGNAVHELTGKLADAPDLTDPRTFDDLVRRLYRRVRANLRQELMIDRERAGLLTDLR